MSPLSRSATRILSIPLWILLIALNEARGCWYITLNSLMDTSIMTTLPSRISVLLLSIPLWILLAWKAELIALVISLNSLMDTSDANAAGLVEDYAVSQFPYGYFERGN